MRPKRSSISVPAVADGPDHPGRSHPLSSVHEQVRGLGEQDALLLATWRTAAPVPKELSDEATNLLDESLRRLVAAALPEGAAVHSYGARHVLAILPGTTTTAAARAGRRARRGWKARWNAPVHCSAAAVRGGAGSLALAEEALTVATRRRSGAVVLVDAATAATPATLAALASAAGGAAAA